jgi:hypothetical protein
MTTPVVEASSASASAAEVTASEKLTVADSVWIAVALLQRQYGSEASFSTEDIVQQVESLRLTDGISKSIWQHVNQHCVANRKAQPNRACMLTATGEGNRRLFHLGEKIHPDRVGGRRHPDWNKLPAQYADLQQWYESIWNQPHDREREDPLLALAGSGRGMWDGMDPEAFVASLRADWGNRQ